MAQRPISSTLLHPRRILVRGVNWLGDAVMTTPALHRLREAQPQAHITLLTHEKLKDLWLQHPDIDAVLTYRRGESVLSVARRLRLPAVIQGFREGAKAFEAATAEVIRDVRKAAVGKVLVEWAAAAVSEAAGRVREQLFDVALILTNSPRSALEAWLARIPHRIGYARPWRNGFLTQAIPPRPERLEMRKRSSREIRGLVAAAASAVPIDHRPPAIAHPQAHQVREYLRLVAALGANPDPVLPFLYVTADEVEAIRRQFALDAARRWLGLIPGAEYGPAKRWPEGHFIAAAGELQRRVGCGIVIFGSQADMPLARAIESAIGHPPSPVRNLAGRTSLRELCAALKVCDAALTNDTGPMHVAAAVGTPVVAPFGSTSPELTGPGLPGEPRHRLLKSAAPCSPCFRRECPIDFRCLNGITVPRVVEAVMEALAAREPSDERAESGA